MTAVLPVWGVLERSLHPGGTDLGQWPDRAVALRGAVRPLADRWIRSD